MTDLVMSMYREAYERANGEEPILDMYMNNDGIIMIGIKDTDGDRWDYVERERLIGMISNLNCTAEYNEKILRERAMDVSHLVSINISEVIQHATNRRSQTTTR